jgi:hypothetical protein
MRSASWTCSTFLAGVVLTGCGGGSPAAPTPSLLAGERFAIAQQVVWTALSGIAPGNFFALSGDGPLSSLACEQSCNDSTCVVTCPVDETLACPGGGTATDKGSIHGTLDGEGSGEATFEASQTYNDCRGSSGITVSGGTGTTASGHVRFLNGKLAGEQTASVAGTVDYSSADSSGRCKVDIRVSFTPGGGGSAGGSACGEPVRVSF